MGYDSARLFPGFNDWVDASLDSNENNNCPGSCGAPSVGKADDACLSLDCFARNDDDTVAPENALVAPRKS